MSDLHHLSYSQLSTYAGCGMKWYLQKRARVDTTTWFATVAGSAFHEATEEADLLDWAGMPMGEEEVVASFNRRFTLLLEEAREAGIEVRPSGKLLKKGIGKTGGPNKKDEEWYRHFAPMFVKRYLTWREVNGLKLASINGMPAVELNFEFEAVDPKSGLVTPVIGSIDRVFRQKIGRAHVVVDIKSGEPPKTPLQLATYGVGLQLCYDIETRIKGQFWSPLSDDETGLATALVDLGNWTPDMLGEMYAAARRGIDAEAFLPNVTNMCSGCTVKDFCSGYKGQEGAEALAKRMADNSE